MAEISFFDKFDDVKAYFTTRNDGVSKGYFSSLNMGYMTDDLTDNIKENREIVKKDMNISDCIEIIPKQVHKSDIAVIDNDFILNDKNVFIGEYDALITNRKNILLTTCHADCLAVYLYDSKNKIIGLAHAGWRGTKLNIATKTAQLMVEKFGADIKYIKAAISPGISKCCFEVGKEVYLEFEESFPQIKQYAVEKSQEKYNLDLKGINQKQLNDTGITDIEISEYCTSCSTELFYSYRKENGKTGRMCAGIVLL